MLQNYLLTQLLLLILFLISTAKGLPSSDDIHYSNATINTVTESRGASSGTTESYSLQGNDQKTTSLAVTAETGSSESSVTSVYLVSSPTASYADSKSSSNGLENSQEPTNQSFKVSSKQGTGIPDIASSPSGESITSSSGKTPNVPTAEPSQTTSTPALSFESRELSSSQRSGGYTSTSSLITISTEANFASSGFASLADSTSSQEPSSSAGKVYLTSSAVTEQLSSSVSIRSDLFANGVSTPIQTRSLTESAGDALSDTDAFQSQIILNEFYGFTENESTTFGSTAQTASPSLDGSPTSTSTHNTPAVTSSIPSTSTSSTLSLLASDTTSGQLSYVPEPSSKQSPVSQSLTSTDEKPLLGSFSKKTIELVASEITPSDISSSDTSTVQTTQAEQPTTTSIVGPTTSPLQPTEQGNQYRTTSSTSNDITTSSPLQPTGEDDQHQTTSLSLSDSTTSNPLQPTEDGNQYRATGSSSTDIATASSSTQQTEEFTLYPSVTESQTSSDERLSTLIMTTDSTSEPYFETTYFTVPSSPGTSSISTESSNELPTTSSTTLTKSDIPLITTDVTSQSAEDRTTFLITTKLPDTTSSITSVSSASLNPPFVSLDDTNSVPSSVVTGQTVETGSYLPLPTSNSASITMWPEATNVELTAEVTSPEYLASTIGISSSPVLNSVYTTDLSDTNSDHRVESATIYGENPQESTLLSSTRQIETFFISTDGGTLSMAMEATTISSTQPMTEVSNYGNSLESLVAFDSQSTEKSGMLITSTFLSSTSPAPSVVPDTSSFQSMPATDLRTVQSSSFQHTGESEPVSSIQSNMQPTASFSGMEQASSYQVSEPRSTSSRAITDSQLGAPTWISSSFVQETETVNSPDSLQSTHLTPSNVLTNPIISASISTSSIQESNYGGTLANSNTGSEPSESTIPPVSSSQGSDHLTYPISQVVTATQSLDTADTADSMGALTTISASSTVPMATGTWWLPSSIEVQSQTSNADTSSFNPSVTASLPHLIAPQSTVVPAPDSTKITIGFARELNFEFLVDHPQSSAQIFAFLPSVLVYPFNANQIKNYNGAKKRNDKLILKYLHSGTTTVAPDSYSFDKIRADLKQTSKYSLVNVSDVEVIEIQPMTLKERNYLLSVAVVYFPGGLVSELESYITNTNSTFYHNPNPTFNALAQLIDPSIPLTGLVDGSTDGSSPVPAQEPQSGSQPGASKSLSNDQGSGSLETSVNSYITLAITKRLVAYLLCFVFGTLLWILASLLMHRYLQNFSNRRANTPITFRDYEKREYLSADVTSRHSVLSSAQNLNSNLTQSINKEAASSQNLPRDLVVTSDNTVYSVSHDLEYYVSEDGYFYYAGALDSTADGNESTKHTSPDIEDIDDFLYSAEQESSSLAMDETYDIGSLEIDDEGNFIVSDPSEEVEPIVLETDNSETVESYNNRNLYKMTGNTNSYESSNEAMQPFNTWEASDPSRPIQDLRHGTSSRAAYGSYSTDNRANAAQYLPGGDSIDEYLYEGAADAFSATSPLEVQIDEADDDVIDIHVQDLDELDEEMYRRLSKIMEHQQNNESGNLHISNVIAAKVRKSGIKPRSSRRNDF